jgi:hypothetical protein
MVSEGDAFRETLRLGQAARSGGSQGRIAEASTQASSGLKFFRRDDENVFEDGLQRRSPIVEYRYQTIEVVEE